MKLNQFVTRVLVIATFAAFSCVARAESMGPTLDRIAQRGTIFLAHREASVPFSFVLPGRDQPEGFSIEICGHVIKAIEEKLGNKLAMVPVPVTANSRVMMIKAGMADIECGVTTNTIARSQQVAFSTTFFVSEVKAMVRADSATKSMKDMANKRIVTTVGSTSDRLVKLASMAREVSVRSLARRTHEESMQALVKGDADVFVADDAILVAERAQTDNPESYVILDEGYSVEPYGLIFSKDDPQFKQLVDEVLIGLMKSGQMEKIYKTWFMSPIPPKDRVLNFPISPLNKAALSNPSSSSIN